MNTALKFCCGKYQRVDVNVYIQMLMDVTKYEKQFVVSCHNLEVLLSG
jgi:hypothetical protein